MEISSIRGYPELGMEDPSFINQWHMACLEYDLGLPQLAAVFGDNINHPFSLQTLTQKASILDTSLPGLPRPSKQLKPNGYTTKPDHHHLPSPQPAASSPLVLNFPNPNHLDVLKPKQEISNTNISSDKLVSPGSTGDQNFAFKEGQGAPRISPSGRISHSQDHIIAERKRREKLSQRFIALSAIVPGLKKMDKASVLGDAIKYLKHLQERVETLEEQTKRKTMEAAVVVKKSQLIFLDSEKSQSEGSLSGGPFDEPLPEIEARFCDREVLVRIHCEKRRGVLEKVVSEIENLHLSVINSSVLTFGSSVLDVTIIAQMDLEFSMSVKELAEKLKSVLEVFM